MLPHLKQDIVSIVKDYFITKITSFKNSCPYMPSKPTLQLRLCQHYHSTQNNKAKGRKNKRDRTQKNKNKNR